MPLALVAEFLGHSGMDSVQTYAYADTEMKRIAIQKATKSSDDSISDDKPIWGNDNKLIQKLYGLI
jgi:integrase/recombinase XerD